MVSPAQIWDLKGKKLKKFESALRAFGGKDYPIINGMALNQTAFETSQEYKSNARRQFTLRNKFTERSIQFDKARGFNPRNQFSVVGSTMNYMEEQEFGITKTATGKRGVAIPTTTASGEPRGSRPRRKVVPRSRHRSNIKFTKSKIKARTRKQHIVATIRATAARGSGKFIYLPIQRAPGIYRVTGKGRRAKIKLIYDLSRRSINIERRPTLNPAVQRIGPRIPSFYKKAFERRMKKSFRF